MRRSVWPGCSTMIGEIRRPRFTENAATASGTLVPFVTSCFISNPPKESLAILALFLPFNRLRIPSREMSSAGRKRKRVGNPTERHRRLTQSLNWVLLADIVDLIYDFVHVPAFTSVAGFDAADPIVWPLQPRKFTVPNNNHPDGWYMLSNVGDGYRFYMNAILEKMRIGPTNLEFLAFIFEWRTVTPFVSG